MYNVLYIAAMIGLENVFWTSASQTVEPIRLLMAGHQILRVQEELKMTPCDLSGLTHTLVNHSTLCCLIHHTLTWNARPELFWLVFLVFHFYWMVFSIHRLLHHPRMATSTGMVSVACVWPAGFKIGPVKPIVSAELQRKATWIIFLLHMRV